MADYDGAIREFKKALALYPHWVWGWIKLSVTYSRKGALGEGLEAVTRAEVESGGKASPLAKRWMAYSYSQCGGLDRAQAIYAELLAPREGSPVDPAILAEVHASMGDTDASIEQLERAFRDRSPNLYFLKVMPRIFPDRVYTDPRYRSLLERMRLV
jgi:tetratricopeptide (TPR) repeat protein